MPVRPSGPDGRPGGAAGAKCGVSVSPVKVGSPAVMLTVRSVWTWRQPRRETDHPDPGQDRGNVPTRRRAPTASAVSRRRVLRCPCSSVWGGKGRRRATGMIGPGGTGWPPQGFIDASIEGLLILCLRRGLALAIGGVGMFFARVEQDHLGLGQTSRRIVGIVDERDRRALATSPFEPVMRRAVDLDQFPESRASLACLKGTCRLAYHWLPEPQRWQERVHRLERDL